MFFYTTCYNRFTHWISHNYETSVGQNGDIFTRLSSVFSTSLPRSVDDSVVLARPGKSCDNSGMHYALHNNYYV